MLEKLNCYVKRLGIFLIMAALLAGMTGCPSTQPSEIRDWHDLNAVRDNLRGNHILMNDLDSTTAGYTELASPTANQGNGWQPIGTEDDLFTGTFDGQGYEIRDLFSNHPNEMYVGLFGVVGEGGVVQNIGVVNADVTGYRIVGGLVGDNEGTVSNSYSTGSVTGSEDSRGIGGLVGANLGTMSDSYSSGSVTGDTWVGGLVGWNEGGTVSNSYSTASANGEVGVGSLVGASSGIVSNSYSTGSVTGNLNVGGLVGQNTATVSNSYSTGSVTGNTHVGGLVGENTATVRNSYSTGSVTGNTHVGGLVGRKDEKATVGDSFWDIETSGQTISDGGTGKTPEEMMYIDTFSGAGWNINAVALGLTDPDYIWNIVDEETYPFLSWQP